MIEKYCTIERIRFNNNVDIRIVVDDALKYTKILKFTLQPIIENCYIHGFEESQENAIIIIEATIDPIQDDTIIVSIIDNGKGFSQEAIGALRPYLENDREVEPSGIHVDHIGLINICYRITSYYGSRFGVEIIRSSLGGAQVNVRIPYDKGLEYHRG